MVENAENHFAHWWHALNEALRLEGAAEMLPEEARRWYCALLMLGQCLPPSRTEAYPMAFLAQHIIGARKRT